jgi:hypothetical protein
MEKIGNGWNKRARKEKRIERKPFFLQSFQS